MAETPTDWAAHYAAADTPWDLGGPHPELSIRLQDGSLAPPSAGARALVPGAGRSHDALALARRGWQVTAVDRVEQLAPTIGPALERAGGTFLVADVLEYAAEEPFDLVWDHTFFCAIDPASRERWGANAARLLRPGGLYASLVFPVGKPPEEGGPPHGVEPSDLNAVLGASFKEIECQPASRTVQRRTWREKWFVAERTNLSLQP